MFSPELITNYILIVSLTLIYAIILFIVSAILPVSKSLSCSKIAISF